MSKNLTFSYDDFDAKLYEAMLSLGWILPRNEQELRIVEESLKNVELPPFPPELENPSFLIERLRKEQNETKTN